VIDTTGVFLDFSSESRNLVLQLYLLEIAPIRA